MINDVGCLSAFEYRLKKESFRRNFADEIFGQKKLELKAFKPLQHEKSPHRCPNIYCVANEENCSQKDSRHFVFDHLL